MVIPSSHWNAEMHVAVYEALRTHNMSQQSNPMNDEWSHDLVDWRIRNGVLKAALIAGFLIVYDVGPTWCSSKDFLYELLLIRVTAEGGFDAYVSGLRELATHHECKGIITGNGVLRPGLQRKYERAGFRLLNQAFYMEV